MPKIKKLLPDNLFSAKQFVVYILTFVVLLVVALLLIELRAESHERDTLAPAGKIVETSSNETIHLHCTGTGERTVILESGMGGTSLDWNRVQPEIAKGARVCSYDRPGYAWSSETTAVRDAGREADDLNTLLIQNNIQPPYIIVGHSYGGLIARLFAARHIDSVDALIQIDPSHEADADMSSGVDLTSLSLATNIVGSYVGTERMINGLNYTDGDVRTKQQVQFLSTPKNYRTMLREYNNLNESIILARDQANSLQSLKVVYILTENRTGNAKQFCSLSTNCVVKSAGNNDHLIPQNKPELVTTTIQSVLRGTK